MIGSSLDAFIGIPVFEAKHLPPGRVMTMNVNGQRTIYVHDLWSDLKWPLFLSEQRKIGKSFIDGLIHDVESRLFGGCCDNCAGTGRDISAPETGGKCWDCYGTGHPHE